MTLSGAKNETRRLRVPTLLLRSLTSALLLAGLALAQNGAGVRRGGVCWAGKKPGTMSCENNDSYLHVDLVLLNQVDGQDPRRSSTDFDSTWRAGRAVAINPGQRTLTVSSFVKITALGIEETTERQAVTFTAEAGHTYVIWKLHKERKIHGGVPPTPTTRMPDGSVLPSSCLCTYGVFDATNKGHVVAVSQNNVPN